MKLKKEFIKTLHNLQTQKNKPIIEAIKRGYRICYESTEIIKTPIKISIRKKYENLGTDDNTQTGNINGDLSFDGIPVVVANGLADDTAMAAESSNLFFGCGLLSDINQEVRYIDMSDTDGSQNCRCSICNRF